jgi:crossover junction endodeoxyribonuclease RuvC
MRIFGIDPGLSETGWAVIENSARPVLLAAGVIRTPAGAPLPSRLKTIYTTLTALIAEHGPSAVAVEEMFFLTAAHSVRSSLQARGVVMLAAGQSGLEVAEYNPRAVKLALTGSGTAVKSQMQTAVLRALNLSERLRPDDVADAAAIAICHLRSQRVKNFRVLERFGAK